MGLVIIIITNMTSAWIQVDFNIFGDIKAKQNRMIEKQQKERGKERKERREIPYQSVLLKG